MDTSLHVQALVGSAYAGEARRGQPLLDLCYVIGDDWGGREWSLVYNKATGVAGFIAQSELVDKHRNFNCYDTAPGGPPFFRTTVTIPTSLHVQALVDSAYAGSVNPHRDNLLDMCYVIGSPWGNPSSQYWDLVYNRDTGVAGFVSETELKNKTQDFHCFTA